MPCNAELTVAKHNKYLMLLMLTNEKQMREETLLNHKKRLLRLLHFALFTVCLAVLNRNEDTKSNVTC